jgi:ABC-2 type transport system ATP-binding protein
MDKLQVIGISKRFANHKALDNISVNIPENSVFGLLGPNGAGKTTLIRIINLITVPDGGKVLLDGKPLRESDVLRIGYLPEERGLYKKMKVGEQALYLARLKGLSKHDALERLRYWFRKFEIESWWEKKVEDLSKGMQQKVQFIVTVIHEPELLIFDEPFSGFDPINVNIIKDEILNLRKKGATIIFSTHNMASVEELCDNITLINNGKAILTGKISEIKQKFRTNTYSISYRSKSSVVLPENSYEIVNKENVSDDVVTAEVKIKDGSNSNSLLKDVMNQAEILAFNEVLPSVNEIFLQAVSEQNG